VESSEELDESVVGLDDWQLNVVECMGKMIGVISVILLPYLIHIKSRMYNTLYSRYQQLGTVFLMQCKINERMQMTLLNLASGKFSKGSHNLHCDRWSSSF
jgi:hypothetical protein